VTCQLLAGLSTIRVTKVDECGKPVVGTDSAIVLECLASLAMNPNIDTQDDIIYRAANGNLCGVKRGCPSLLGYDIEMNVLSWSPEALAIFNGSPEVLDGAGATVGVDDCAIQCDTGFGLEFWTELIQGCPTTGKKQYLYGVIPWVNNAYLGDLEIGAEAVTFTINGTSRAGGQWDVGPFNVIDTSTTTTVPPAKRLTPLGATCPRRMQSTTRAPPVRDANCAPIAVTA
jgi:hypothetical protein